jgi:hypothetical protein
MSMRVRTALPAATAQIALDILHPSDRCADGQLLQLLHPRQGPPGAEREVPLARVKEAVRRRSPSARLAVPRSPSAHTSSRTSPWLEICSNGANRQRIGSAIRSDNAFCLEEFGGAARI